MFGDGMPRNMFPSHATWSLDEVCSALRPTLPPYPMPKTAEELSFQGCVNHGISNYRDASDLQSISLLTSPWMINKELSSTMNFMELQPSCFTSLGSGPSYCFDVLHCWLVRSLWRPGFETWLHWGPVRLKLSKFNFFPTPITIILISELTIVHPWGHDNFRKSSNHTTMGPVQAKWPGNASICSEDAFAFEGPGRWSAQLPRSCGVLSQHLVLHSMLLGLVLVSSCNNFFIGCLFSQRVWSRISGGEVSGLHQVDNSRLSPQLPFPGHHEAGDRGQSQEWHSSIKAGFAEEGVL